MFHGIGKTFYWRDRYQSVFDRAESLGLSLVGPFRTKGGGLRRQPDAELSGDLPADNVAMYRTQNQTPETAWQQLDYVFASGSIADRVTVRALNSPDEWGPSDRCRLIIGIDL